MVTSAASKNLEARDASAASVYSQPFADHAGTYEGRVVT